MNTEVYEDLALKLSQRIMQSAVSDLEREEAYKSILPAQCGVVAASIGNRNEVTWILQDNFI